MYGEFGYETTNKKVACMINDHQPSHNHQYDSHSSSNC